jgi:hypothetical protein
MNIITITIYLYTYYSMITQYYPIFWFNKTQYYIVYNCIIYIYYVYYILYVANYYGYKRGMIFAKQRHTRLARQGLGHQGLSRTWRDGAGPLKKPGDAMEKMGISWGFNEILWD